MLLDSMKGMRANYEHLQAFLLSTDLIATLKADCSGEPKPYNEFLKGLVVEKTNGPIILSVLPNKWLNLSGSVKNMSRYINYFQFRDDEEGEHHHPEHVSLRNYISHDSLNLILEVDTDYIEQIRTA
jgi:hypothetical protein